MSQPKKDNLTDPGSISFTQSDSADGSVQLTIGVKIAPGSYNHFSAMMAAEKQIPTLEETLTGAVTTAIAKWNKAGRDHLDTLNASHKKLLSVQAKLKRLEAKSNPSDASKNSSETEQPAQAPSAQEKRSAPRSDNQLPLLGLSRNDT